ncbi:HYR domain-containing protein, partial [Saprospiraceae bacterium]|nr:HYR domain-containing protein [Saprospiraceae bacterium]
CKCVPDTTAPELECASSDELLLNGSFADVTTPASFPIPADFAVWGEFGDNFDDALTERMTVKMFGSVTGVTQDVPVVAGDWLCMDAQAITLSGDDIVGTSIWGEVKIEFYDAGGAILNGPFGTVLGDFNQSTPAVADVWTNVGGCIKTPENAVTARAILIFLNFSGEGGAIIWDDASLRRVNPMVFDNVEAGECSAEVTLDIPVATDDCELESLVNDFNDTDDASGVYQVGETIVTYTATDHAGNQSVCSILVVVEDTEAPSITCPDDVTLSNDNGDCGAVFEYEILSNDNCSDVTPIQTSGLASGAFFPLGTTVTSYEVTDEAGNTISCSFSVTVEDTEAPTITCPADVILENDLGECSTVFEYDVLRDDNCVDVTFEQTLGLASGEAFPLGTTVNTYVVTDEAGNTSSCSFSVTVEDTEAPVLTCPIFDINIALDPGDCDQIVDFIVTATDNCSLVADSLGNVIIQTAGLPSGSVFERGTTTNTFEVSDPSGNVSTCSFDVVVLEYQDPIGALVCNNNVNISLDQNCEAFIGADLMLEGGPYGCYDDYIVEIDGLEGQTVTSSGTYIVTVTDPDTGNSCWNTIVVEDNFSPTLECTSCPPGSTSFIDLPFTGTLNADSPMFNRPNGNPANCNPSFATVAYQTHEFLIVTGADSDFEVVSFIAPSGATVDSYLALYETSFDP